MNSYFKSLLSRYQKQGLLIDTNILLLWVVGTINPQRITQFKRTKTFIQKDYNTLLEIMESFNLVITTPNILTEVNSLTNQLGEPERSQGLAILAHLVSRLNEQYLPSKQVSQGEQFSKFGLTDSGILELAKTPYLILTDDFKLANYLQKIGVDVINFNNLRALKWNS